jgi:hypothetical protein
VCVDCSASCLRIVGRRADQGGGGANPGVLRSARPSEAAYSRLLALILANVVDASASSRIAALATSR